MKVRRPLLLRAFCASILLFTFCCFAQGTPAMRGSQLDRYPRIESYEIRPDILVMPRYSEDGSMCEAGIEHKIYGPHEADLNLNLPAAVLEEIAIELAPIASRGPRGVSIAGQDIIMKMGNSSVKIADYENVVIKIYRDDDPPANRLMVIRWKNRKCK